MGGGIFSSALTVSAASEEKQYSNVLDDLQKDPTFDAATFPANPEDVSVQLIQIAESEDKQLFLYVYQPADSKIELQCKAVSISVGFSSNGQGLSPQLYDLILVSTEGVFDKYLVNGFSLPDEAERYYNIVQILREFNAAVDPESDKTEYKDTVCKSYAVGQQWCAYGRIHGGSGTEQRRSVHHQGHSGRNDLRCFRSGSHRLYGQHHCNE